MQLPVTAVVLHEADVSSPLQTLKISSPVQVGLFLLGLIIRGKLGAKSLVTVYGDTHFLDLAQVGRYPMHAEGNLALGSGILFSALRSPEVKPPCETFGHPSRSSFSGNYA